MRAHLLTALLGLTACADLSRTDASPAFYKSAEGPMSQTLAANGPIGGAFGGQGFEAPMDELNTDGRFYGETKGERTGEATRGQAGKEQSEGEITPRLIRTGNISVSVDNYSEFSGDLQTWLSDAGGHIADASLSHHEGQVSWASLTVRVPADRFDTLVGWTEERVAVHNLAVHTQDVTEEWVDLGARVQNHRRTEARLIDILDHDTATVTDVIAVEAELARVRENIERIEGRQRVLADRVGFATLQLEVQVDRVWEPTVRDSFGERVAGAFRGSIEAMGVAGQGAVLAAVVASPWLGLLSLGLALLVGLVRWRRRRA